MLFKTRTFFATILATGLSAGAAFAAPLNPGDANVFLSGTTVAAQPELAGDIAHDNDLSADPYLYNGNAALVLIEGMDNLVVRSDVDGTLVFMPRNFYRVNTIEQTQITRIELYGFGNYDIDANYRSDTPGDRGPTQASRGADGDTLAFDFGFPLNRGHLTASVKENPYYLSLHTNATEYALTGRASVFGRLMLDNGPLPFRFDFTGLAVPTGAPYTPPPAVPLPASGFLLLGGLGLLLRRQG